MDYQSIKHQPEPSGWEMKLDKFSLGTKEQFAKQEWN